MSRFRIRFLLTLCRGQYILHSDMKKKPKMGRPPLPAYKRRDHKFEIRLNVEERKRVSAICRATGQTISDLFRFRVLGLSERELEAIARGQFVRTPDGTKFAD